jgi:hypothetical protein
MKFLLFICFNFCLLISCSYPYEIDEIDNQHQYEFTRLKSKETTIFFLNFDNTPTGNYNQKTFNTDWWNPRWSQGITEGRVKIVKGNKLLSGNVLRIYYPEGKTGPWKGGAQWKVKLKKNYDELYCAYSVKFQNTFDFVLGGKLPGFVGGRDYSGGHRPDGKNGWSARMMWRRTGSIVQYVYHPYQRGKWGDDFPWKPNFLTSYSFEPGRWYTVEHHIKMNTPGKSDGVIEGWLDGQLALRETHILFRDIPSLGIDAFYFSTFFGGQGRRWAPTKDEYIYFDNFIISTTPITH